MGKPRRAAWRRHAPGLCLGLLIGLGGAPHASALMVDPTVVEVRAAPGAGLEGSFQVTNDTPTAVQLRVEAEPLGPAPYAAVPPEHWLRLSPSAVSLAPHEQATVHYAVAVPADAVGELAAAVVFVQDGATGGLQIRFGTAVYVAIAGTETLHLDVGDLRLEPGATPAVRVAVVNRGNAHCRPEGTVTVVGANGVRQGHGMLTRGMPALPGRVERFVVPVTGGPYGPGGYRLEADLACHNVAELPGALTATQAGELDGEGRWQPTTTTR